MHMSVRPFMLYISIDVSSPHFRDNREREQTRAGVPEPILKKIEEVEERRRRRGMHGEGEEDELDGLRSSMSEEDGELDNPALARADREGFQPPGARGGQPWFKRKWSEELIGGQGGGGMDEGLVEPKVGMRVRLSRACQGQGVKGEDGVGTIQWIGNKNSVCHVKWEGNARFDYSYCIGHNGFYDLRLPPPGEREAGQGGGEEVGAGGLPKVGSGGIGTGQIGVGEKQGGSVERRVEAWTVQEVEQYIAGLQGEFGEKARGYADAMSREDVNGKVLLGLSAADLKVGHSTWS